MQLITAFEEPGFKKRAFFFCPLTEEIRKHDDDGKCLWRSPIKNFMHPFIRRPEDMKTEPAKKVAHFAQKYLTEQAARQKAELLAAK